MIFSSPRVIAWGGVGEADGGVMTLREAYDPSGASRHLPNASH